MTEPQPEPQKRQVLHPFPVPTLVSHIPMPRTQQGAFVQWQIQTPTGLFVFFSNPDSTDAIAASAKAAASTARGSGIVAPPSGLVVPQVILPPHTNGGGTS